MEISRQADYAVRAVLHLAQERPDRRVRRVDIVEAQEVPGAFLTKILSRLTAAGIVDSRRGVNGGMKLARPAGEITLLEVVEAVDGPVRLNPCLLRPGTCPRDTYCAVHPVWARLTNELRGWLTEVTFADLARRQGVRGKRPRNDESRDTCS